MQYNAEMLTHTHTHTHTHAQFEKCLKQEKFQPKSHHSNIHNKYN